MAINKNQAIQIVTEILNKANDRFKQEVLGENEETLDRTLRKYRSVIARTSWLASQKWCKWNSEGPVLMPDYTRLYYRKGKSEVVIMELPPQIRLMKFMGSLVKRENTSVSSLPQEEMQKVYQYSLALPYVIFIFKFVEGMFAEVRCAFSDRPLRTLGEKPLRPYLSNIDSNLAVCLGKSFDQKELIKDNVAQQAAFVLSHFWQTVYSDEWATHFWNTRASFQGSDPRMATMETWQEASVDNPLFVVEDVKWLQHQQEDFGSMVVSMLESENNNALSEELYNEFVDEFLKEISKNFKENIENTEEKILKEAVEGFADLLLEKIK